MKKLQPLLEKAAHIASTGVNSFLREDLDFGLAYNEGVMLVEVTFVAIGMNPDGRCDGLLHADPGKDWTTQLDVVNDDEVVAWASFATETTGGINYDKEIDLHEQMFARNLTLLANHTAASSSLVMLLKYHRVILDDSEMVGIVAHRRG
ncbi:hypothetical protein ES703_124274 [subsurface metagenome]